MFILLLIQVRLHITIDNFFYKSVLNHKYKE